MKQIALITICASVLASVAPPAEAGPITRACIQSARAGATPQMCGCIQRVADTSLNRSEQRLASKFFQDPHMAQVVRQSDRRSDEAFWERYKAFGALAAATCG